MSKSRKSCVAAFIVAVVAVVSVGVAPAWAIKSEPTVNTSLLHELLQQAMIDLEEVNAEIDKVKNEIEQVDQLILEMLQEYESTRDPRLLRMIDVAWQDRAELLVRRDNLIDEAADLQAYIAFLKRKIEGSSRGPKIDGSRA